MTPERWRQIRDLLERAMELALAQRAALLDRSCASDPSLRQEVEPLLASSDDVRSSFMQAQPPHAAFVTGTRLGSRLPVRFDCPPLFAPRDVAIEVLLSRGRTRVLRPSRGRAWNWIVPLCLSIFIALQRKFPANIHRLEATAPPRWWARRGILVGQMVGHAYAL